ncbi:uncharacterized protein [Centruroides vittatus]|uniref:uncharacterized protein isoform X2 n=1 Tax=Centruroides vittatus TaxID=120091 RepID=UPI00350F0D87
MDLTVDVFNGLEIGFRAHFVTMLTKIVLFVMLHLSFYLSIYSSSVNPYIDSYQCENAFNTKFCYTKESLCYDFSPNNFYSYKFSILFPKIESIQLLSDESKHYLNITWKFSPLSNAERNLCTLRKIVVWVQPKNVVRAEILNNPFPCRIEEENCFCKTLHLNKSIFIHDLHNTNNVIVPLLEKDNNCQMIYYSPSFLFNQQPTNDGNCESISCSLSSNSSENYDDYDYYDDTCSDWNAIIYSIPGLDRTSITVHIKPSKNNKCTYNLYLMWLYSNISFCNSDGLKTALIPQCKCTKELIVEFFNLKTGNYCIGVEPLHRKCYGEGCIRLIGGFVNVEKNMDIFIIKSKEEALINPYFAFLIIIPVMCTFIVWILNNHLRKVHYICSSHHRNNEAIETEIESSSKKVEVLLLFCQDCIEYGRKLKDLFENCFKVKKVNSVLNLEDEVEILKSGTEWISHHLEEYLEIFKKSETIKKVVIIESEKSVYYQKLKMNNQMEFQEQTSLLHQFDILFIHAISNITSNLSTSLLDYLHLLVVHFKGASKLQNITPERRFCMPQDLVRLYCNLTNQEWQIWNEEHILNKWKDNSSYIEFINFVNNSS